MRGMALRAACMAIVAAGLALPAGAQEPGRVPHGQSRPPGPALSPAEAIRAMTVPEGFKVELVASEPDLVNPVAMTFDERGRIWVTESLEYPRKSAGPGRDRIKVMEDTDGDGAADKFTIFAEGLNIPSGIAVGYGGVWVANAPDILFLRDTDGDGKADTKEVVATGFGRDDTHELPNSLTWGPDGWLYGLNGVFNRSRVASHGEMIDFTCALFRINPRTRDFELFCEGTSNPWGVAWDTEGSAFVSACVIDHLWHLAETGYYHRQGGPYPPHTWKIESIVGHRHQKAAYCGLHYFDSDAYPPMYRDRLYMGNIHGNGINVDTLKRNGSTYIGESGPDFLSANDAWFMPVVQKTGPDGCLYILDWYDRYHCYQDANRDPEGIDRLKGRLYRVRYRDTPRVVGFDLARESDDELIERLHSPNVYFRDLAQRLLSERNDAASLEKLQSLVLDDKAPRKARMHALWALVGARPLATDFQMRLLAHADPSLRAWGVRAAGNAHRVDSEVSRKIVSLARDPSPDVALQVAIAAGKLEGVEPLPVLLDVLAHHSGDPLIPKIVWQNLHPLLDKQGGSFVRLASHADAKASAHRSGILPRAFERLLARPDADPKTLADLFGLLSEGDDPARTPAARNALAMLAGRIQTGEVAGARLAGLREQFGPITREILAGSPEGPLYLDAALLAASWKDPAGLSAARESFQSTEHPEPRRLQALQALVGAEDDAVLDAVARTLQRPKAHTVDFRGQILAALGDLDDPRVAEIVLAHYPAMEPELKPRAIELLTQRDAWGRALLLAVARKQIPADVLNLNQVRKLLAGKDPEIIQLVKDQWGTVREGRNPGREQVIQQVRASLRRIARRPLARRPGLQEPLRQCHKIYGEGQDVGPDITLNGRGSFDQLLSNLFDPSLVIGAAYQATTLATTDGRVLTGLLVEESPQRVILKTQGGKLETIPREELEEMKTSPLSLMPEDLEKQLKPQELADLLTFLAFDKPPGDPTARPLPGADEVVKRPAATPLIGGPETTAPGRERRLPPRVLLQGPEVALTGCRHDPVGREFARYPCPRGAGRRIAKLSNDRAVLVTCPQVQVTRRDHWWQATSATRR